MALVNTVGAQTYNDIFRGNPVKDYSPAKRCYIQTAVTLLCTAGTGAIFQSASTAKLGCGQDAFHLQNLNLSVKLPTTTSELCVFLGAVKIISLATAAAGNFHYNFGDMGLVGPDNVATNCVSLNSTIGGCTVDVVCTGYYEV